MLRIAVEKMVNGFLYNGYRIYAKKISKGRFREEVNLTIHLKYGTQDGLLLYVKVFHGREPYYKPWAEFFDIHNNVKVGDITNFFNSPIEHTLLSIFTQNLEPGGKIFVEYYMDEETRIQLENGFPPPITRLGYILFELGFTWFKNWYFPEGFMEGGQKLQGEKPKDDETRGQQIKRINGEVRAFLERTGNKNSSEPYVIRALERAENILRQTN